MLKRAAGQCHCGGGQWGPGGPLQRGASNLRACSLCKALLSSPPPPPPLTPPNLTPLNAQCVAALAVTSPAGGQQLGTDPAAPRPAIVGVLRKKMALKGVQVAHEAWMKEASPLMQGGAVLRRIRSAAAQGRAPCTVYRVTL